MKEREARLMAKPKLKLKPTKYPLPLDADRMAKLEATMKKRGFEYLKDAILYTLDLGFDEKPEQSNKNSIDPEVTTRESDPDYDKYLKDTAPFDTSKIAPAKPQPKAPSVFEHFQEQPCPYRAIVKEKSGSFSVYCDTKKLPPEVCIVRQKRYLHFNRNCYPETKKKKPRPHTPTARKPKVDWGDSEGVDSFSI